MSVCTSCRRGGSREERLQRLFDMFDGNRNGVLDCDELQKLCLRFNNSAGWAAAIDNFRKKSSDVQMTFSQFKRTVGASFFRHFAMVAVSQDQQQREQSVSIQRAAADDATEEEKARFIFDMVRWCVDNDGASSSNAQNITRNDLEMMLLQWGVRVSDTSL